MRFVPCRRALLLATTLMCLVAVSRPARAQSGTVQGTVTDTSGAGVRGATVSIDQTGLRLTTSTRGTFTFTGVPSGRRVLRVRSFGFAPESLVVTVTSQGTTRADVTLRRAAAQLAAVNVVVGSRARHTAAEELAVPVDVYTAEDIARTGSTETSQVLAVLSPSVNFPKQAVTDATEIVRPFTLRGLSPDHSLVLINGVRRHQTALLNVFSNGSAPGSSGVDLNAFPSSAIGRIEVLRDGASTQYGSDAIAGVVNVVLKEGRFAPFVNASVGQYRPGDPYPNDGTTTDVNGGVSVGMGRGSLSLFGQVLERKSTNRACPGRQLPRPQWDRRLGGQLRGDRQAHRRAAAERALGRRAGARRPHLRQPQAARSTRRAPRSCTASAATPTARARATATSASRRTRATGPRSTRSASSRSSTRTSSTTPPPAASARGSAPGPPTSARRTASTASTSTCATRSTRRSVPSLSVPTAPGPDGVLGTADDPGIPNQLSFNAGGLRRGEFNATANASRLVNVGFFRELNVAVGAAFRRESYEVLAGERASYINGFHLTRDSSEVAQGGSSVFQGFAPSDASLNDRTNLGGYVDLETNLTRKLLANAAGRFENYSDFGNKVTGKLAARYQATRELVLRGAASTGFRAPGLAQSWYSHTTTAIQNGTLVEIGNFPVTNRASRIFGAKPLKEETSTNLSGGFAWSPTRDINLTVDIYRITIKDRILLGATFDGSTDPAIAKILRDSGLTQIAGVQFPTNAADTRTNGVDVSANWRVPTWRGSLDLLGAFNYTDNLITRIDPLPAILNGTGTILTSALDALTINAIERNRPNRRSSLTANYAAGRFHALVRGSDYGSFRDGSSDGIEDFGAKALMDAEVGYQFNAVTLSVGANNVFNTFPDPITLDANRNNGTFTYPGSSPFGYNGRYLYVRSEIILSR